MPSHEIPTNRIVFTDKIIRLTSLNGNWRAGRLGSHPMQIIEATDQKIYNQFLTEQNGSVLQSWEWGEFQKKIGRKVWRLQVTNNIGRTRAVATMIRHPWPRGLFYLYCAHGPVIADTEKLSEIWKLLEDKISDIASIEKPVLFRLEPPINPEDPSIPIIRSLGFKKISWHIQPNQTLLLDLEQDEQQLLHAMKPKTRYNIRLAEKRGVVIEENPSERYIKDFWKMLQQTTTRDRFAPHSYPYYINLLEVLGRAEIAKLVVATYKQRPLAAAIVSFFGNTAVYLHGASSDKLRALMAPHLVQWAAIKEAKKRGKKYYDFGGIAPTNSPKHSWAGITRFKRGFGGNEIEFAGTYDRVYRLHWYWVYRVARKLKRLRD